MLKEFDEEFMDAELSDSSDDNDEKELEKQATSLEASLSENKFLYDTHVELVRIYKQLGDLTSLRLAYERFKEIYPLTPKLWLDWLRDEIKLSTTPEQKRNILPLFEQATEDYLSVDLWLEYIQFAIGSCNSDEARSIIEKALNAAGVHTEKGSLLWDSLRELELAHLSIASPESKEFHEYLSKVIDIYKRQLSVPLLSMQSTYKEFQDFVEQLPEGIADLKQINWNYNNALKTLDKYKVYEDKLLAAKSENETYEIFKEYINSVKDPSVILCLYERAVEKLCLRSDLWLDYCKYALKLGDVALKISYKALRNVTWCEMLWVMRLKILEKFDQSNEDVMKCFENGIASIQTGKQLWIAYLSYTKRYNSSNLMKLFDQCEQVLPPEQDPFGQIMLLHANICAEQGNLDESRRLFKRISELPSAKSDPCFWSDVINFERKYGDERSLRTAYTRAVKFSSNNYIADQWMCYELLQDCEMDNLNKCYTEINKLQQNYENYAINEKPTNKRKRPDAESGFTQEKKFKSKDLSKNVEAKNPSGNKERLVRNQGAPANLIPEKSVFVSNISPTVTLKQLSELFENGRVTLATDSKGASRCFGFVQFKSEEDVQTALQRDRELFESRPIFISKCKVSAESRKESFKYSTSLENNKLFVKGLPVSHTKEDVEKLFAPYNYTDVRLVMQRSGQFKGLAYVDFGNADDAENALKATNDSTVGGFIITVAISNPPRKNLGSGPSTSTERKEANHPKSRIQVPLVPRSLQVKQTEAPSNGSGKPKSNADFRNMFIK